jgi:hypothetical protein
MRVVKNYVRKVKVPLFYDERSRNAHQEFCETKESHRTFHLATTYGEKRAGKKNY